MNYKNRMNSKNQKEEWLASRKVIVWEPELLISGIVLIGLLQIPKQLDNLVRYLNDWGPTVFYNSNIDELLVAFLKTSVFFLIIGLIVNLFMRSIWVVMIGMSIIYPRGLDVKKLQFQPFYEKKVKQSTDFVNRILTIEKICSYIYSLTFFSFMCVIGIFFLLLIIAGGFMMINDITPFKPEWFEPLLINILDVILKFFGALLLLDFISLGWFKRIKWLAWIYRPFYVLLSFLTLSRYYRGIYYSLISEFSKWKVFLSLIAFIIAIIYVWGIQQGEELLLYKSKMYSDSLGIAAFDGYYRDKNADRMSNWMHIPSMTVKEDVLEIFVAHKAALEDSILSVYERSSGYSKEEVLQNNSLKINAFSHFYGFELNGVKLPPIPLTFMNFNQYNQKGVVGFIPLDSIPAGQHNLVLRLKMGDAGIKVSEIPFYKTQNGTNFQFKSHENESETSN